VATSESKDSYDDLAGKKSIDNAVVPVQDPIFDLTEKVMKKCRFKTMRDNKEIYYYHKDKHVYVRDGEGVIEEFCQKELKTIRGHWVQEVIGQVSRSTRVDREKFDSDLELINTKSCVLNIHTKEQFEHTPDKLFLSQVPVRYCPVCKCPKIMEFLLQVLRPKDFLTAIELFGYCLLRGAKYHKALMCVGEPSTGKSTFLQLFDRFLGPENVSHESLQDLSHDKFKAAELYGKLANVYADLKTEKLLDTGKFKMLASGDRMSAQQKYRDPFDFNNHAVLIFSANEMPTLKEEDDAFFRRLIMFVFDHSFKGQYVKPNLIDELTTEEEMSGLLNLALIGLRQLTKDGRFRNVPEDWEEAKAVYEEHSSSRTIEKFIEDCRVRSSNLDEYVIFRDLYWAYVSYCKQNRKREEFDNVFGAKLKSMGFEKVRLRIKQGEREYCIVGIKFKETKFKESVPGVPPSSKHFHQKGSDSVSIGIEKFSNEPGTPGTRGGEADE
jgi:putative DNA primase/helicase